VLGAIIGVIVGPYIAMLMCDAAAERIMAERPNIHVCGLIVIPYLFLGVVGGVLGGVLLGQVVNLIVARGSPKDDEVE
jgi:hypothetical protein